MKTRPFHNEEDIPDIHEVNVVPLADVSLVLLIILIVLSPMMTHSTLRIRTAAKESGPAEAPEKAPAEQSREPVLTVGLSPEGILFGDRTYRGPGPFMAVITAELNTRDDKKVFLVPHLEVSHGRVVNLIELLRDCGAESVALVQLADEEPGVAEDPS